MAAKIIALDGKRWLRSDLEVQSEMAARSLDQALHSIRAARRSIVGSSRLEMKRARDNLEKITRDGVEIAALARDIRRELDAPTLATIADLSARQKAVMTGHPSQAH